MVWKTLFTFANDSMVPMQIYNSTKVSAVQMSERYRWVNKRQLAKCEQAKRGGNSLPFID